MIPFPAGQPWRLSLAALLATASLQAWGGTPDGRAGPVADAPVYRSALESYRPYRAQPVQPWRATNDEVGRIGGWRAYAREAADPAPAQDATDAGNAARPSPAPASTVPGPDPHAGHHGAKP